MSRKRERQRENRRELARQLGVHHEDVPEELIAHERVTEPVLKPSLVVTEAKRGWFRRGGPVALHVALFVVDRSGVRLARLVSMRGTVGGLPAEPRLEVAERRGPDVVRYLRPGRFVVVALLTEHGDDAGAHAAALADPARLRLVVGGTPRALDDAALARMDEARAAQVLVDGAPLTGGDRAWIAAAARSVDAAHRVHEKATLPLASDDGRLAATLTLELRL